MGTPAPTHRKCNGGRMRFSRRGHKAANHPIFGRTTVFPRISRSGLWSSRVSNGSSQQTIQGQCGSGGGGGVVRPALCLRQVKETIKNGAVGTQNGDLGGGGVGGSLDLMCNPR